MFDLKFRFDKKQVKLEECQRDSVDFCQVLSRKLVLTILRRNSVGRLILLTSTDVNYSRIFFYRGVQFDQTIF